MSTDSRTETSTVTAAEVSQQPLLRTEIPGPRSRELHARRQAVIPPGVQTSSRNADGCFPANIVVILSHLCSSVNFSRRRRDFFIFSDSNVTNQ